MFESHKKRPLPDRPARDVLTEVRDADAVADRLAPPSKGSAAIGRSIKIEGDLSGEEDLRIEGEVSGTIHLPNHALTIGTEGRIHANAHAKSVTVDGEVNGDLYGSECVNIRANARVEGNVVAARVSLEEGAQFKGSIDMDPHSVEAATGESLPERSGPKRSAGPGNASAALRSAVRDEESQAEPAH